MLATLLGASGVANVNLAVASIALPAIGRGLDASQTGLDLIAVGYTLGLAASVLYLSALGDRYGRKLMLELGVALSVPAALLAAYAPSVTVLTVARLAGGLSAGMSYPTALALVTALWSGAARTRTIAWMGGVGAALTALGPLTAGLLLDRFWWGSAFLLTVPLAAVTLAGALAFVPAHVNESNRPVDHLGGVTSVLFVGAAVMAINFAPVPGRGGAAGVLALLAVAAGAVFFVRQGRARVPLFDLRVARRRLFWVPALGGLIVFGALTAMMYVGQQFVQNVLGYSPLQAGLAIVPSAVLMMLISPVSARLIQARGSRFTLLAGYLSSFLGFAVMLAWWRDGIGYGPVFLGYALMGMGARLAGTPATNSLTGSVPVQRAGMASATADLQGDLGGAIMQSVLGALLAAGYAKNVGDAVAASPDRSRITSSILTELQRSFASAEQIARRYPAYADKITRGARIAFEAASHWAHSAGLIAVALGAVLVFLAYPRKQQEQDLFARYHAEDTRQARLSLGVLTLPGRGRRAPLALPVRRTAPA